MARGEKEAPIIFNDEELEIRDVQSSLNEFFKSQDIDKGQEQELRDWFKREYKRIIDRKDWQTEGKPDRAYHAAVLSSVLGELKAKVERVKIDAERGESRLNPFLETKAGMRKKLEMSLGRIKEAVDGKAHVVVLVNIDLDDFKAVNDNYGHEAGDEVLKKVGKALEAAIRPTDFGAHYSGDEFGILMGMDFLAGTSMRDIRKIIKNRVLPRVIQAIQEPKDPKDPKRERVLPLRPDGRKQELSAGFRIVEAGEKGEFEDFSKDADMASEFSKIVRIAEENAGRKIESAKRIVDFSEVMEMAKKYTREERVKAKAIRDMKRALGELESAVPVLKEVDIREKARKFIEELMADAKARGGGVI